MAGGLERFAAALADFVTQQVRYNQMMQEARGKRSTVPEPQGIVPAETLRLREKFTDAERKALKADGALLYTPLGETIPAQKESREKKCKPGFWYVAEGEDLLVFPSRQIEVAIYPAPDRAFVPGSFNKSVKQQEECVAADAADLRKRLGLKGIGEIIPDEASTVTDIIFQHEEATDQWLLGPEYAAAQGLNWVYTRTKNPTNSAGSFVASVGDVRPVSGVSVDDWGRGYGYQDLGVLRMVVPIDTK